MRRYRGFSIAEVGIVAVVAVIAGLLVWRGYDAWRSATTQSATEPVATHDVLPQVKQKSDLELAQKTVEDVDPDSLDTSSIDQTLK